MKLEIEKKKIHVPVHKIPGVPKPTLDLVATAKELPNNVVSLVRVCVPKNCRGEGNWHT